MIDTILKIINNLPGIIKTLGFDLIVIVLIAGGTQAIKMAINKNRKKPVNDLIPLFVCLGLGLAVGIFQIVIFKAVVQNWIRIAFGYPAGAVMCYQFFNKFVNNKGNKDAKK